MTLADTKNFYDRYYILAVRLTLADTKALTTANTLYILAVRVTLADTKDLTVNTHTPSGVELADTRFT